MKIVAIYYLLLNIIMVIALLSPSVACEPIQKVEYENQTDLTLTIYRDDHKVGLIEPHSKLVEEMSFFISEYLIEAKDEEGETIYSRKYTVWEIEESDFKIVIPAE